MLRNLTQKSLNSDKIPSNFFCTLFAGYDVYSPSLTSPKYHIHWWTEAPYYQTQRAYLLPGLGPLNRKRKIEQVETQGKDPKNQNTTRSFASFLPSTWPDCPSHHCRKDDGIKVHRKKKKAKTRKAIRRGHLSIIFGILLLAISSFAAANFLYPESSVSTGAVFFLLSIAGCNWLKHLEKLVGYVQHQTKRGRFEKTDGRRSRCFVGPAACSSRRKAGYKMVRIETAIAAATISLTKKNGEGVDGGFFIYDRFSRCHL